jgi:hypothetical protein
MRNKTAILLLAGATALLFLLSAGVAGVRLLPGRPFSLGDLDITQPPSGGGGTNLSGDFIILLIRIVFIFAVLGIPVLLIYSLVSPEGRRRMIANIAMVIMVAFACLLLQNMSQQRQARDDQAQQAAPTQEPAQEATRQAPTDVFTGQAPDWAVIAASVGVAMVVAAVGLGAGYAWWRRRQPAPNPLQPLANEAQGALDALRAGSDLTETVVRCYYEMGRVAREARGIERETDMTPREFERALQTRGMPAEAVRQLTRLFEQVRYGHQRLGQEAEQQAVASLSAIVAACDAGRAT